MSLHIRAAQVTDHAAITRIIVPTIRAGETYALDRDLSEAEALAYWIGPDRETFVAEDEGMVLGTYYLRANQTGGGAHVSNCGFMTGEAALGRGVARAMCADALDRARARGFAAMQFNFVVSTNVRAVRLWDSFGFDVVGRLPGAFRPPELGTVDALVMFRTL
ncbi:GNAT family N-acetyltransferase [Methylobacterium sp. P1-11]|uniref:GNAT family N-acetyltransferase n=1 Tax=Methylobacterium sp. P1-11 TaxID=2024616 RepID=UPI0011EC2700|nr:GNAT family N-acetyltransferase [Methylobacterium sp. P1-11]KAA0125265.1 GNAT family N-acetyltransferase [Methylobacterium sp. P1-11]